MARHTSIVFLAAATILIGAALAAGADSSPKGKDRTSVVLNDNHSDSLQLLAKGEEFLSRGENDRALSLFIEAVNLYPGNARAVFLVGYCHEAGSGVARDAVVADKWYGLARRMVSIDTWENLKTAYPSSIQEEKPVSATRKLSKKPLLRKIAVVEAKSLAADGKFKSAAKRGAAGVDGPIALTDLDCSAIDCKSSYIVAADDDTILGLIDAARLSGGFTYVDDLVSRKELIATKDQLFEMMKSRATVGIDRRKP